MTTCCPLSPRGDDGPSFSTKEVRRAAKPYRCCECREDIAVGARHEVYGGCWDGEFSRYRTCLSCVEIRNHFACNGWVFLQLWEDLEANFFPDMKAGGPCMQGLSPAARNRLFERRTAWLLA